MLVAICQPNILGDYSCPISKLKQYLAAFAFKKLDLIYILDGRSNPYKEPENLQRAKYGASAKDNIHKLLDAGEMPGIEEYCKCVCKTSIYRALVTGLLCHMKLNFIVSSHEADGGLVHLAKDGVVISKDFDTLALGADCKIAVN
eukprot:2755045-Ditylum_brightwellii.AAC.1